MWRQTGRKPKELDNLQELPENCYLVWKYFTDLHHSRTSNGFGHNPISYTEMNAYFSLHSIDVSSEEIDIIKKLDYTYLEFAAKEAEKEK